MDRAGGELHGGPATGGGTVSVVHDDLYVGRRRTLTAQQIGDEQVAVLLDARAPERFRGESESGGSGRPDTFQALRTPDPQVLATDGTFRTDAELVHSSANRDRRRTEVGVYCEFRITASV